MIDIRSLERTLLDNLPWNKARIKFVARFLLALYAMRTVNLSITSRSVRSLITRHLRSTAPRFVISSIRSPFE